MLIMMGKKIITILYSKLLLNWTGSYVNGPANEILVLITGASSESTESMRICAVSSLPLLLACTKYECR